MNKKIILLALGILSFLPILALAVEQSHPLTQIHPMNISLNLTGVNITNVSYIYFGNNSVDTYLYRSGANILRTDSDLLIGNWLNGTNANFSLIYENNQLLSNRYLLQTGGTLTGNLNMGNNSVTNVWWLNSTNINASNIYQNNNFVLDFSGFNAANLTSGTVPLARLSGITTTQLTSDLGLGWANFTSYPSACTASQYISAFGDTLTCLAISITESQISDLQSYITSNNMTGYGIAGYVPLWSNTTGLNKSIIYQLGGNIGIGTTMPNSTLHVFAGSEGGGTANPETDVIIEDDSDAILEFRSPSNKDATIFFSDPADQAGGIIYDHTTNRIQFRTNGANRNVVVDSAGRVGIGTVTPTQLLQVFASGVNSRIDANRSAGSVVGLEAGLSKGYIGTQTSHPLGFLVGASTKMTIDTSGNVGIGTVLPQNTLNIIGTLNVTQNVTIQNTTANSGNLIIGQGQKICFNGIACTKYQEWNGSHIVISG